MPKSAEAVYENGVLRLLTRLALQEGEHVRIMIEPVNSTTDEEVARQEADAHRSMEADGMMEHFAPPTEPLPADWQPLVLKGEPLSETILRMRREA